MNTQSSRIAEVLAEWQKAVADAKLKREARQAAEADYKAAIAEWREACRVWAEEWTAKLWQPWELSEVRYVPLRMPADFDYQFAVDGGLIEKVVVLNDIADCVAVGANLTEVKSYDGRVSEIVIGAFLDVHVIKCDAPSTTDVLAYHRHYSEGGYVVNVPAFVAEQPGPAPEKPATPEGVREIYKDEEIPF